MSVTLRLLRWWTASRVCWRPVCGVRGAGLGAGIRPTDTWGIHEHECACKSREWRGGGVSSQTNSNPDQPGRRNRAGLSVFLSLRLMWVLVVASECCWGQRDGGSGVRVLCAPLWGTHSLPSGQIRENEQQCPRSWERNRETTGGSACTCWVWVAGKEEFLGLESTWGSSIPITSFNNHHGVCEPSCCSSADLGIAASLRWGGTRPPESVPAKPPAQSGSSWGRQGLLGGAGAASEAQCLVERAMLPQELRGGHRRVGSEAASSWSCRDSGSRGGVQALSFSLRNGSTALSVLLHVWLRSPAKALVRLPSSST